MGFMDWLKGTFGKQTCAFCGNEVGMLKRTKIKNKEFICNDCKRTCSRFIQVYRMTKDELLGHMEYMKRQEKLYNEVVGEPSRVVPSASSKMCRINPRKASLPVPQTYPLKNSLRVLQFLIHL